MFRTAIALALLLACFLFGYTMIGGHLVLILRLVIPALVMITLPVMVALRVLFPRETFLRAIRDAAVGRASHATTLAFWRLAAQASWVLAALTFLAGIAITLGFTDQPIHILALKFSACCVCLMSGLVQGLFVEMVRARLSQEPLRA